MFGEVMKAGLRIPVCESYSMRRLASSRNLCRWMPPPETEYYASTQEAAVFHIWWQFTVVCLIGPLVSGGQVDVQGNVSVSTSQGLSPGCGGFLDMTHCASKVVFMGTFTRGGLQVRLRPA